MHCTSRMLQSARHLVLSAGGPSTSIPIRSMESSASTWRSSLSVGSPGELHLRIQLSSNTLARQCTSPVALTPSCFPFMSTQCLCSMFSRALRPFRSNRNVFAPRQGIPAPATSAEVLSRVASASSGSIAFSTNGYTKPVLSRLQHCWDVHEAERDAIGFGSRSPSRAE